MIKHPERVYHNRHVVEWEIAKKLEEIKEILEIYAPDDYYFTCHINEDGEIWGNNSYWDNPEGQEINFKYVTYGDERGIYKLTTQKEI